MTTSVAAMQAPLDIKVSVLDPTPAAPAAIAASQTLGSFRDAAAVRRAFTASLTRRVTSCSSHVRPERRAFAKSVDVLTVEIEHVDVVRKSPFPDFFSCLPSRFFTALAMSLWGGGLYSRGQD